MKKALFAALMLVGFSVFAQTEGYKVGDAVTDFKLKNIDGKQVSMADYKDARGYIIVFTCNTCPYAVAYQDRVLALNKAYAAKGYPVIAINPNDPVTQPGDAYDKMQERAKEKGFNFPYLTDPDHIITKQFGASRTPHVFIVQKSDKGNIVQYIGAIDNDTEGTAVTERYAENALNSLLAGEKPAVNFTKAVGCGIKWKKSSSK